MAHILDHIPDSSSNIDSHPSVFKDSDPQIGRDVWTMPFYFLLLLYNIVLVLPYIDMNLPQVYMCSTSWTLLSPSSPYHPSGSSSAPAPSILYHASNLDWPFISHMIIDMFQCHSPKSSHPLLLPQSPKDCSNICVFFAISHTGLSLPSF